MIKIINKTKKGLNIPTFIPNDEDHVYRAIHSIVGDKLAENGIPLAQEVAGWADLATIGEQYEVSEFVAICK